MSWFKRFFNARQVPAADTTPPTTPGGLSATAANPSVLSLATLSTDNVAVTGYQIWRKTGSGGTYAQIGTTLTWPWTDTNVLNGTSYFWKTLAFDVAGNQSPFSNEATAAIPSGLAPDTTPPLTPGSAPTLVSKTTTQVSITFPTVADSTVNSGSQVVSGMKDYLVKVNGTVTGSPVTQPSGSLTFNAGVDIGTPSPAGTDSVVSGTFTLSCGGTAWGGVSADQLHLKAGPATGDFDVAIRFTGLSSSSGNANSKLSLVARDGTDPGALYIAVGTFPTLGQLVDFRTSSGGTAGWNGAVVGNSLATPQYGRLTRTGNIFKAYIGTDGATWTLVTTQTIGMTATLLLGLGICAQSAGDGVAGQTATGTADSLVFSGSSIPSFTDTFAASATPSARLYTVAGRDNANNVGTYGASLSVTPAALSGTAIAFNPGLWREDSALMRPGASTPDNLASMLTEPSYVIGLMVQPTWALIETSFGVYDFTVLTSVYNSLASANKRMIIEAHFDGAGFNPGSFNTTVLPAYLNDGAGANLYGGCYLTDYTILAKMDRAAVANRYIALLTAIGTWAVGKPFFEGIQMPETSWAVSNPDPAWNGGSGLITQLINIVVPGARTALPNSMICARFNWGTNTDMTSLAAACLSAKVGTGTTDAYTQQTTMESVMSGAIGGHDYRLQIPQTPCSEYSPFGPNTTADTMLNYVKNTLKASYFFPDRFTGDGWNFATWDSIKSTYVANYGSSLNTSVPSSY